MYLKYILLVAVLFTISAATPTLDEMERYIAQGFTLLEHKFGGLHFFKNTSTGTEQVLVWPKLGLFTEKEHFEAYYKNKLNTPLNASAGIEECVESQSPNFFKFAPTFVGYVRPDNAILSYTAPCFSQNTIVASIVNTNTIELIQTVDKPGDYECEDAYMFATLTNVHLSSVFVHGIHKITFTNLSPLQYEEIVENGMGVFRFCDKLKNLLPDLVMTAALFLGGFGTNPNTPIFGSKPPEYMQELNVDFILQSTGYQYEKRPSPVYVDIDQSLINSGDFFAVTRFDGLDQIIEYGAGSHSGHSVVGLRADNGTLFICESQAGWYWPRSGIQCNEWSQWTIWAQNADFHVTWLPLKPEYSAAFNQTAAWETVDSLLGYPYGYHNFIFGWVDTATTSLPPLLSPNVVAPIFSFLEYWSPSAAAEILTLALNMRLEKYFGIETNNLTYTLPQIGDILYELNMTFPELYETVELDEWVYPDGPSLVCSSFVVAVWKGAGLFGDMQIQATEFTPKDVYQMTFIDPSPPLPEACTEADPTNPFCQLMGKWRMQFPGVSSVDPYNNMNQVCESVPPLYARIPLQC
jgi:hypothetical protein